MSSPSDSSLRPPAAVLKVTGPDALTFLQGQFTQDLRPLQPGGAVYGLWLNQKGKVLGDSHILRDGESVWRVVSETFAVGALRERLEHYLIADEVELEDETAQWWLGVGAVKGAAGLNEARLWQNGGTGADFLALVPRSAGVSALGAVSDEERRRRYRAVRPWVPGELTEADLPQEAGLERVAISFQKGCYLGQEVMARLEAMGAVRRRLLTVEGDGPVPPVGTEVFSGPKRAGELRGAVVGEAGGWVGLAMLNLALLGEVAAGRAAALTCAGQAVRSTLP